MRIGSTIAGGIAVGGVGALGFFVGPIIGTLFTVGGAVFGAAGGPFCSSCFTKIKDVEKIANEARQVLNTAEKEINITCKEVRQVLNTTEKEIKKTSATINKSFTVIEALHGGIILALGGWLWAMRAIDEHYNPTRGETLNVEAEVVRYSSTILTLAGLAMITFSVIKFYKHLGA